jgi:hypothetical protein
VGVRRYGEGCWDFLRVLAILQLLSDLTMLVGTTVLLAQDGVFGTLAQLALQGLQEWL